MHNGRVLQLGTRQLPQLLVQQQRPQRCSMQHTIRVELRGTARHLHRAARGQRKQTAAQADEQAYVITGAVPNHEPCVRRAQ
jgi:hypothetical protein